MTTFQVADEGGRDESRYLDDALPSGAIVEILDSVGIPILVVRRDFTIACFNQAAADVLGLVASDIGCSPRAVSSLAGLPHLEGWCAQVVGANVPMQHDFHKAQQSFVIRIAPYSKRNGQISSSVLSFINVTAFRASIDQAIYEREYTKTILNTVADPLVVLGADLRIETANRSFYSMFRVPREAIQGLALNELNRGSLDFPWLIRRLRETIADDRAAEPFEVDCDLPEIGRRTLLLHACQMALPGPSTHKLLLSLHDVTELKTAEAAKSKLAAIVEFSEDSIVTKDIDGIITSWNDGARLLFGYQADEAIGKPMALIVPPDRRDEEADILARIRRGERTEHYDTVRQRKNESLVEVSVTVSPLKDAQGKIIGASNVARDITERRHEMRALTLLNQLNVLLVREGSEFDECIYGILDAAIFISRADKGNIQLRELSSGGLEIAAQRGFEEPFLRFFAEVSDKSSACGVAMESAERVVVEDVTQSDIFAGQPSLNVLLEAGVRAVISTPLTSSSGNLLGMISTHFNAPHPPNERESRLMNILTRQAADYLERKRAEEKLTLLAREVDHRAKNLLAVMQVTINLTQADSVHAFKEAIGGRVQALANVHTLLAESRWTGAELHRLVEEELSPFCTPGTSRAYIEGPELILQPSMAQLIAIVLHELVTNAVKYGALSVSKGYVRVNWSSAANGRLVLRWTETDGPPVKPPTRQGFGTRVLNRAIHEQLKGKVQFDWRPEGLACEIEVET